MTETDAKRMLLIEQAKKLFNGQPAIVQTDIPGFSASMRTAPTVNQHCFYQPMVILVLQGKKNVVFGTEKMTYQEGQFAIASVDIPTIGSIIEASPEKPFLTLILELDSYVISQLLSEGAYPQFETARRGSGVADADEALTDAFLRLLSLTGQSERQKVMAPMIIKEIHYLLLTSPLGGILCSVNTKGSQNNQIANAIAWLKNNFRESLNMEDLAQRFNMAASSFYRHFNKVTSLSPLQYQKQLRLHEARRLMISENISAENAAYEVGYESASQFNREYKRMFGMPPKTNINQIKQI